MSTLDASNGPNDHGVRYIPLHYNNADSEASATRLVVALFPDWEHGEGKIEFTTFKDGITNTLMKAVKKRPGVPDSESDKEAILLRAYGNGTEILIDRERETTSHTLLALHSLAPSLLARFSNGLLYSFIPGVAATSAQLSQPAIYRGVARRIAQWHALLPILAEGPNAVVKNDVVMPLAQAIPKGIPGAKDMMRRISPRSPVPNIWSVMQKWILALEEGTESERAQKISLQRELERSAEELSGTEGWGGNGLVFGHCDLLSGNVILPPATEQSNGKKENGDNGDDDVIPVTFIDYEYATPSPPAFDLANHFSEWGGFECDYSVLPTRSARRTFITEYVAAYASHASLSNPNNPSSKTQQSGQNQGQAEEEWVRRLEAEIDLFRGIPGLYWGIWALIQAKISRIEFDYASYADKRLGEYWDWRRVQEGKVGSSVGSGGGGDGDGGEETPLRERRWGE